MTPPGNYPRRVLMTLDAVGGVWRYAMTLGEELTKQGVEIVFAGFGPAPDKGKADEARALGDLIWCDLPLDWMSPDGAGLDAATRELSATAARSGADLLHLNLPSQAAGLEVDVPVVAVSHSCVPTWFGAVRGSCLPPDLAWHLGRNRRGLETADAVVAPSASHAAMLTGIYGDVGGVAVVPNAVQALRPAPASRVHAFAAARWWDESKNAAVLDAAAALMDLPLTVAGATASPSGQRVTFRHADAVGEVPGHVVRGLMAAASIVVSPSRYEPFGLAVLEAASAGRALVLADIPTYRELWDGCARFVDPDDATGFARAANALAADPGARRRLGEAAHRRAGDFSPARQVAAMRDVYSRATARRLFTKGIPA